MTKYLVVGRSGTGKSSIVRAVCAEWNMTYLKSYTTRPMRDDDKMEPDHIFITEEEVNQYKDDMAAWTEIGGYQYFSTKRLIQDSNFYIIDPAGVEYLKNTCWDEFDFKVIYVRCNEKIAALRTKDRVNYSFEDRRCKEDEQFTQFEKRMDWDYHILNNGSFEEGVIKMKSIIERNEHKKN